MPPRDRKRTPAEPVCVGTAQAPVCNSALAVALLGGLPAVSAAVITEASQVVDHGRATGARDLAGEVRLSQVGLIMSQTVVGFATVNKRLKRAGLRLIQGGRASVAETEALLVGLGRGPDSSAPRWGCAKRREAQDTSIWLARIGSSVASMTAC
jgi:hypothetical protein